MKIETFIKAFIFALNILLLQGITYDCTTNGTVFLENDELVFFQTPEFPKLMTVDEFYSCNLTFAFNKSSTKEKHKLLIYTRTIYLKNWIEMIADDVDDLNLIFQNSYSIKEFSPDYDMDYISQQGYVLFEKAKNKYPMETLTKFQSFQFDDETQSILVFSDYKEAEFKSSNPKNYSWQFSAPNGYGFKVYIESNIFIQSSTKLTVINSTDIIINERSLQLLHPYYNNDNYIQINLENPYYEDGLFAYVSIVKKTHKKEDEKCRILNESSVITWTNIQNTGYENNRNCMFELIIPPNSEMLVYVSIHLLEEMDFIQYYREGEYLNNSLGTQIGYGREYVFRNQNMTWEFVSDGSGQSLGFEVTFTTITCECPYKAISCDQGIFIESFCGNLRCNFTILPCLTDTTLIELELAFDINALNITSLQDSFRFISDNVTVCENILEIMTFPNSMNRMLILIPESFVAPLVDKIIKLGQTFLYYIIDTGLYNLIEFNITANMNTITELHCNLPKLLFWYNDVDLIFGKMCFDNPDIYSCNIDSNNFVLLTKDLEYFPFLVLKSTKKNKNCVLNKTIFHVTKVKEYPEYDADTSVVGIATSEGDCEIIILAKYIFYRIKSLWTTAVKDNVKVYAGTEHPKLLFEFNHKSAHLWKDVSLHSIVYKIIVPKSSTVYIKVAPNQINVDVPYTYIPSFSYLSLLTSPCYGISKKNFDSPLVQQIVFGKGNYSVRLTALEYNIPSRDKYYFKVDGKKLKFKKAGDFFEFKAQKITVHYSWHNNITVNGAVIFVETFKNNIVK